MDLDNIWQMFITFLAHNDYIESACWKKITGIPFLYIKVNKEIPPEELEKVLKNSSEIVIKGMRLHSETIFVRKDAYQYVYRHRFYVPQEKMFCCGNMCVDCVRMKEKNQP